MARLERERQDCCSEWSTWIFRNDGILASGADLLMAIAEGKRQQFEEERRRWRAGGKATAEALEQWQVHVAAPRRSAKEMRQRCDGRFA